MAFLSFFSSSSVVTSEGQSFFVKKKKMNVLPHAEFPALAVFSLHAPITHILIFFIELYFELNELHFQCLLHVSHFITSSPHFVLPKL